MRESSERIAKRRGRSVDILEGTAEIQQLVLSWAISRMHIR